jgi:hypothetical protein
MNMELIRKRKRQLCGESVTLPYIDIKEDLAAVLKLTMEHKPVTRKEITLTKMNAALPLAPDWFKPFGDAVIEMYK